MMKFLNSSLDALRAFAIMEGCSFLLFGITMPLKYKLSMPGPNYVVGMIHGVLFIIYIMLVLVVAFRRKWSLSKTLLAGIASVIPFGTFIADAKIFKKEKSFPVA